jgi:hypothetical protein
MNILGDIIPIYMLWYDTISNKYALSLLHLRLNMLSIFCVEDVHIFRHEPPNQSQ